MLLSHHPAPASATGALLDFCTNFICAYPIFWHGGVVSNKMCNTTMHRIIEISDE